MFGEKIKEMQDSKEKELLMLLEGESKPFMRKCDGYARMMDEDKEISYKDHNDQELTLKVPKGSYIVVGADSSYPEIRTAEDFEMKNKMMSGEKKDMDMKKSEKAKGGKIGMASMMGETMMDEMSDEEKKSMY